MGGGEKCADSESVWKVERTGFSCRVDVGRGEERMTPRSGLSWLLCLDPFAHVSATSSPGHSPPNPHRCQTLRVSPMVHMELVISHAQSAASMRMCITKHAGKPTVPGWRIGRLSHPGDSGTPLWRLLTPYEHIPQGQSGYLRMPSQTGPLSRRTPCRWDPLRSN